MKKKRTAEGATLLFSIRSSRSKILLYLAPIQLFTQLPCQTPTHPSLKGKKPFFTLPQSTDEGNFNGNNLPLSEGPKKKKKSNHNLVKLLRGLCTQYFSLSIFQKILLVRKNTKLYTLQIHAGATKLTQEVKTLKIVELSWCSVILPFPLL